MKNLRIAAIAAAAALFLAVGALVDAQTETTATVTIRGKAQTVRTLGTRGRQAVIVSSGDGGWVHLAPHVASVLAARGFFVVGVDAKAYLSSFTSKEGALTENDVPGDYRALVEFASPGSPEPPILIGVSEGAGLSVLAATRQDVKDRVRGVIGIGLPEKNELGWRWRDSIIYLTHGVPNEPTFDTSAVIERVAPVPCAAIHSTRDEFVPLPTLESIMAKAREPKRLWTISASDHRFSDKLGEFDARLLEAISWINGQPGSPAR